MKNKPLKVGITGGIGTGKTTVTKLFRLFGVPVYDADSRAKKLMESDSRLVASIISVFGEKAYKNKKLNRQLLAQTVFNNKEQLAKLNSLVHPAVATDFDLWMASFHKGYIIKEAALLFETGSYKELDYLILVVSPLEVRIERIKERDLERPTKQIKNIISKQMSPAVAITLVDYVVHNDENHMLIPQVQQLHKLLSKKAGSDNSEPA